MPDYEAEPRVLQNIADVHYLAAARDAGRSFHEMGPEATAAAAAYGYYTTAVDMPRWPGLFPAFVESRNLARVRELLADRATTIFAQTDIFREAALTGRLGRELADTFGAVTHIHGARIRQVPAKPKKVSGSVIDTKFVADYMDFTVPTAEARTRLAVALQGLQADPDRPFRPVISPPTTENGPFIERAENISEYDTRLFNTIIDALLTREERAKATLAPQADEEQQVRGVVMPEQKWPLKTLETPQPPAKPGIETFEPVHRKRLLALEASYERLVPNLSATYEYDNGSGEPQPDYLGRVLATKRGVDVSDRAAALTGMRRIFNGLIWHVYGGSQFNQEQDPDELARLPIERGIYLKRPHVTFEDVLHGPPAARAFSSADKARLKLNEILADANQHKVRATARIIGLLLSVPLSMGTSAIIGMAGPGVARAPLLLESGRHLPGDYRAYRRQKIAAAAADAAIDRLIQDLHMPD